MGKRNTKVIGYDILVNYSYGQGETRIGANKENNNPKKSHEILIVKK